MTTNRRPMSGRGQESDMIQQLDAYNKASKTAAVGKFMRTFSRTKKSKLITTWDDTEFFWVLGNHFYILADVTGDVDANTTISAQMEAMLDIAWELYYKNANLKDLVAAEEAAWKLYFSAALFIATATQIQYNFRTFLPAYAESDTTPGSNTALPYFSQASFDVFLASMKDYEIPKGVWEIVDIFCTWVIQIAQPYERFTLRIPGAYVAPFQCQYDLEDLEAARDLMRTNLGNAITHGKKFGLKFGKWRDPVKPTIKNLTDPTVIAFLCHANITFTDDGTDGMLTLAPNGGFTGTNLTTDYTSHEYMFKSDPNESLMHLLAPWFGLYDATNNPYGGLILENGSTVNQYTIGASSVAQHGIDIVARKFSDSLGAKLILQMHKCAIDNFVQDGDFNVVITGANLTADQGMDDAWVIDIVNGLHYGSGRGAVETNNDLINWLGRLLV